MKHATIAPPNSLILVMDHATGLLPDSLNDSLITATDTCVAIGTRAECDGETDVYIGSDPIVVSSDVNLKEAYHGTIATSSGVLTICDVYNDRILDWEIGELSCSISVFVNDSAEPSIIHIVVTRGREV